MNADFTDTFILDTQKSLANHEIRLTNLEETTKDIKALTKVTSDLAYSVRSTSEKLDANQQAILELKGTVQSIVDEPKKNWVTIRTAIFSSIGGSVGTGVVAWLLSMLVK